MPLPGQIGSSRSRAAMTAVRLLALVGLGVWIGFACSSEPATQGPCTADADCLVGQQCVDARCVDIDTPDICVLDQNHLDDGCKLAP